MKSFYLRYPEGTSLVELPSLLVVMVRLKVSLQGASTISNRESFTKSKRRLRRRSRENRLKQPLRPQMLLLLPQKDSIWLMVAEMIA